MENIPGPEERRESARFDYATPLAYKVCKKETLSKLLTGYTSNISTAGLLCNFRETVNPEDVLWLSFDRGVLSVCAELEKRVFIYQNGIIGKVVRVEPKGYDNYDVGIKFLTREEQNFVKQSLGEDEK
ncbi:MAG: PilZ domain-containing protein [Candidatus Omnitrophica bacterium]|nr:PilZ domain-containing protein [Candidatus Omnitrophota bacterium]MDD5027214.1 PilZ domain-containing protein [Candidatus Omnitrophota bacterium]MDD5661726.1 PilZ domain-containing protein [Candidatus Omnitrophota bacterium]